MTDAKLREILAEELKLQGFPRLALKVLDTETEYAGETYRVAIASIRAMRRVRNVDDMTVERRLLERCKYEIENLSDKVSRKEEHGWEGTQRRTLLLSDLKTALT